MGKAKTQSPKKSTPRAKQIRHARIELDENDFQRLKSAAKTNGLSVAAYIRQAVLRQIRRDESEGDSQR